MGIYYYFATYVDDDKCTNDKIIDNTNILENNSYTYSDMEGVYTLEQEVELDGTTEKAGVTLYLWKDGTFKYVQSIYAPIGQIENYIIEGNNIKLNYLFKTTSGTGLSVIKGNKTLIIKSIDSIDDSSIEWGTVIFSGTLNRSNTNIQDYETYEIYNALENNEIIR